MHCFRHNKSSKYDPSCDDTDPTGNGGGTTGSDTTGSGMSERHHVLSWFDWVKTKKQRKRPKRRLDRYNHGRDVKGES